MTPSCSAVAILLFTRSAGEEAQHKRFVSRGSSERNACVAAQLIQHAQVTAARAGVDVICLDSGRQTGLTFGERLVGAMQQVFQRGYEQLLVIGNDCPQLDELRLQQALSALRRGSSVLGPATDGGIYLLGVSREQFETTSWQALPWQTKYLMQTLRQLLLRQDAAVELLPTLTDVDDEQDLAQVLRQFLPPGLRRRLHRLRSTAPILRVHRAEDARDPAVAPQPQRGPPAS